MKETVDQKMSKSDLLVNRDKKITSDVLEEGSKDLYDIIKFCCAIKENPRSPNLKEWSRKEYSSDLNSMVYENSSPENVEYDEKTRKVPTPRIGRPRKIVGMDVKPSQKDDVEANDLIDQFEKLIQMYDSYGAFRRLAAQKLGVPTIRVTIKEINEITKQVHKAYQSNPGRQRIDKS